MLIMSEYPNLDDFARINIFCSPKKKGSPNEVTIQCDHIGYLDYDGYNQNQTAINHRVSCSRCGRRFGKEVNLHHLLVYQTKLKKIIYEIFSLKYNLKGIATRWGIAPEMLSRFKKRLVQDVYAQNHNKIEILLKTLPRGIILGDETFMGKRGKSDSEVLFINDNYETLSTGPVVPGKLNQSIQDAFGKIPTECSKKLKILMSDGEPSYKSIVQLYGGKVIHLIQYHNRRQLGQVSIEKYEKVGPHLFHYIIQTHWKAFAKGSCELKFKWKIKFIKRNIYQGRGRPLKNTLPTNMNQKWRQKVIAYQTGEIKKTGSATVFVNVKTNKISKRRGSTDWMIRMLTPLFKKFKGKYMTTGLIESKHHQIKHTSGDRKQQEPGYNHLLFALSSYIIETGHIPNTNLQRRPLYKYLIIEKKKEHLSYVTRENGIKRVQKTISVL